MASNMLVKAIQRGTTTEMGIVAGKNGDMNVSLFLPKYAQLVAAGKVFAGSTAGGTSVVPIAAWPTTTASWSIYNANSDGTYLVVLQAAVAMESGTAGLGAALIGTVAIGDQTAEVANYSGATVSCLDGSAKVPNAFLANATTLVGTQSSWFVLAQSNMPAAVQVGAGVVCFVDGLMIVPPRGCAGFDVLAPLGTAAKWDFSIVFAQVQLDLA